MEEGKEIVFPQQNPKSDLIHRLLLQLEGKRPSVHWQGVSLAITVYM